MDVNLKVQSHKSINYCFELTPILNKVKAYYCTVMKHWKCLPVEVLHFYCHTPVREDRRRERTDAGKYPLTDKLPLSYVAGRALKSAPNQTRYDRKWEPKAALGLSRGGCQRNLSRGAFSTAC